MFHYLHSRKTCYFKHFTLCISQNGDLKTYFYTINIFKFRSGIPLRYGLYLMIYTNVWLELRHIWYFYKYKHLFFARFSQYFIWEFYLDSNVYYIKHGVNTRKIVCKYILKYIFWTYSLDIFYWIIIRCLPWRSGFISVIETWVLGSIRDISKAAFKK